MSCQKDGNFEIYHAIQKGSFDSYLSQNLFGDKLIELNTVNKMINMEGKIQETDILFTDIAIGQKNYQNRIMFVTILITILSTFIILGVMATKKSKKVKDN